MLSILLLLASPWGVYSQAIYSNSGTEARNYYISGGYGFGTSFWSSKLYKTQLYDQYGAIIKSGDLKFKSKTSTRCYDINVTVPVSNIHLGLGLNFEENSMDKIDIQNSAGIIVYDQKFRLDKFYALIEFPLQQKLKIDFKAAIQARFGYYGYSGVDRENFFGEEAMANTYFVGIGAIANFKIMQHVYFYLYPNFEYKYFNNNAKENPANITHNIATFNSIGGLRINVSSR